MRWRKEEECEATECLHSPSLLSALLSMSGGVGCWVLTLANTLSGVRSKNEWL